MNTALDGILMFLALQIFMVGGIYILFKILEIFAKNFEKERALPVFALAISAYILAVILASYYAPRFLIN